MGTVNLSKEREELKKVFTQRIEITQTALEFLNKTDLSDSEALMYATGAYLLGDMGVRYQEKKIFLTVKNILEQDMNQGDTNVRPEKDSVQSKV